MIALPLAFVLFGVLMTYAGFVPALLVLIFGSALAEPAVQAGRGRAVVGAADRALSVALFVWGLGLPYPLIADF